MWSEFSPGVLAKGRALLSLALSALVLIFAAPAAAQTNVVTQHNDNARTGANTNETLLTPANVNQTQFGKLFSYPVDGLVYTQPLYVPNISIPGKGTHNVLFVATEHDGVYAFDADSNAGPNASPLWQISLLDAAHGAAPGATTEPPLSVDDIQPEVGITGTPVIDPATGTLYVVGATAENGTHIQRLHALDITTGAEKISFNSPVQLQASVPGTGTGSSGGTLSFDPYWENQRPGLLLLNGIVYIAYGARESESLGPNHGWILAYNATTLQRTGNFCATPNGSGAGIWMSGSGLAADVVDPINHPYGRMFVATGNGSFNAAPPYTSAMNFSDDLIRLDLTNGALTPVDSFTPFNQDALNRDDRDTSSGGVLLFPDQSTGGHTHLLVQSGKEGRIFLVDRDNMGGYSATSDAIVQEIPPAPSTGYEINGIFGMPAYWNGNVYFWGSFGDLLKAFSFTNGQLSTTWTARSPQPTGQFFPAPTPVVSANGNTNGIVWTIDGSAWITPGPAVLLANDALNVATLLYSSNQNLDRDNPGVAVRFVVPTVINGKVYVGAEYQVSVYGLLSGSQTAAATPTFSPAAGTYSSAQSVTLNDTTSGASIYYTTDGTTPTTSSTLYNNKAIPVNSTETINAIAVATGFTQSAVGSATYTIQAPPPPDFSVSAMPASQSVTPGGSTTYTVTVGSVNGFGGVVTLSVSGQPAGATPGFNPTTITSSGISTLTVSTTSSTANGTYPLTITGTSGSLTHTTSITLTITPQPNFSLSASPSSLSIRRGGSGTSTITVNPLNGFGGSVSLSASGFSKGVSASFNPSSTTTRSILTLVVSSTASLGNSRVTVTGTSGSLSHTTTISLKVTQH